MISCKFAFEFFHLFSLYNYKLRVPVEIMFHGSVCTHGWSHLLDGMHWFCGYLTTVSHLPTLLRFAFSALHEIYDVFASTSSVVKDFEFLFSLERCEFGS